MAKSEATTVEDYLTELTSERRETVGAVRAVILKHLPEGFEEVMDFGMISYVIPLSTYPTPTTAPTDVRGAGIAEELLLCIPDEHLWDT